MGFLAGVKQAITGKAETQEDKLKMQVSGINLRYEILTAKKTFTNTDKAEIDKLITEAASAEKLASQILMGLENTPDSNMTQSVRDEMKNIHWTMKDMANLQWKLVRMKSGRR